MVPSGLAAQLPVLEVRLGPGRLPQVQPWASLTAGGGHLVAGSDAPATAPDPWAMFATLITRQNAAAEPFDGWQPQERLSREAALATLTSAGAYAGFAEGRFGRLAPGQRADFLLVDRDPLLASPGELRAMRVLETWVGGQRVWAAQD